MYSFSRFFIVLEQNELRVILNSTYGDIVYGKG